MAGLSVPTPADVAAVRDDASPREAYIEACQNGNGAFFQVGKTLVWMRDDPSPRKFVFTFATSHAAAAMMATLRAAAHLQGGAP